MSFEESQKYKEGKFIVEKQKVIKVCSFGDEPEVNQVCEVPAHQTIGHHFVAGAGGKLVVCSSGARPRQTCICLCKQTLEQQILCSLLYYFMQHRLLLL